MLRAARKTPLEEGECRTISATSGNVTENGSLTETQTVFGATSELEDVTKETPPLETQRIKEHKFNFPKGKTIDFLKDKYHLILVAVLVLVLLTRLKYIGQESLWNDAAVHLWYVIKVTKEPLFILSHEYLLGDYAIPQTIMTLFYFVVKDALTAGKIVAVLYSLVGVVLIYLLGSELKSKFVGVMAAILLAFNHIFWFYSVRPLGDSPLMVSTIFIFYCMVRLEKEKTMIWGFLTGTAFVLALFHKVQSSIFILGLVLYYILFKRKEMIRNKPTLVSWLIPVGTIVVGHLVAQIFYGRDLLGRLFGLMIYLRGMPFGFEAAGMLEWVFSWYLIPFVFLGALFVVFYKYKRFYPLLVLGLYYWFYFEVNVDNTQDRYVLPLLPIAILLAVFAIEEIASYLSMVFPKKVKSILKHVIVIAVVLLLALNYYQVGDPLIYNKSFSYTGHAEAGQWMKENIPEETPIFAGSYRFVRLFTEREFGGPAEESFGGSIWNLRAEKVYASNRTAFEEDLLRLSQESDVYLEIDHIEYTQPSWYYPLTEDSVSYFASLGFNLVHVVNGKVLTNEGVMETPMIFIFKKDKVELE